MMGIRVTVRKTAGSVPRGPGTQMMVWSDRISGTIGGGALEWRAMRHARDMLLSGKDLGQETIALGPALGQCCGGSVTLDYALAQDLDPVTATPLWIWGAGHVGRAIAEVTAALPDTEVTLIDNAANRFPPDYPGVMQVVAADMPSLVPHAPAEAHHLIVTYDHHIDLALCHALLSHGFGGCGLIGSATKWARFQARLQDLGHANSLISGISCPIGDPSLGKHPHAIAVGVAAALLTSRDTARSCGGTTG